MDRLQDLLDFKKVNSLVGKSIATASLLPEDSYTSLGVDGLAGDVMVLEPVLPNGKVIVDIPEVRRFLLRSDDSLRADVITVDENGKAVLGPAFVKCMSKNEFISKYDGEPLYGILGSISSEKVVSEISTVVSSIPGAGKLGSIIDEIAQERSDYVNDLMADYDVDFDDTFKKVVDIIRSLSSVQNIEITRLGSTFNRYEYKSTKTGAQATLTYHEPNFDISFLSSKGDRVDTNATLLGYCDTKENANEIASSVVKAISHDDSSYLKMTPDTLYKMFTRFFEPSAKTNNYTIKKVCDNGKTKLLINKLDVNDKKVYLTAKISTNNSAALSIECIGENDRYESGFSDSVSNIRDYTDLIIVGKCISKFFNNCKEDIIDIDKVSPEVLAEVRNMYMATLKTNYRAYKIMKYIQKLANRYDMIRNEKNAEIVDESFSRQICPNEICYTMKRHFNDGFVIQNKFSELFPDYKGIELNGEQFFETLTWKATADEIDLVFKVKQDIAIGSHIKVYAYLYAKGEKFSKLKMYDSDITDDIAYTKEMRETFENGVSNIFLSGWMPENIYKSSLKDFGSDIINLFQTLAKTNINVTFE